MKTAPNTSGSYVGDRNAQPPARTPGSDQGLYLGTRAVADDPHQQPPNPNQETPFATRPRAGPTNHSDRYPGGRWDRAQWSGTHPPRVTPTHTATITTHPDGSKSPEPVRATWTNAIILGACWPVARGKRFDGRVDRESADRGSTPRGTGR